MRLQRYINERMVNRNPFILSNPSLPEVHNVLTKSSYNTARGLYDNNTKKLFIWEAGANIHYTMFKYLLENGFIPEDTDISDMKQVLITQTFDDQGNEDIAIEVNQYKSIRVMDTEKYTSIPQIKKLFYPSARDMNNGGRAYK